jgi:hypothetical protein
MLKNIQVPTARPLSANGRVVHWTPEQFMVYAAQLKGIPIIILLNYADHKWHLPNDNAIQWTAKSVVG